MMESAGRNRCGLERWVSELTVLKSMKDSMYLYFDIVLGYYVKLDIAEGPICIDRPYQNYIKYSSRYLSER